MESTDNPRYLTVPFFYLLPNNEHISHECYLRTIEIALHDIFVYGSYQPTILSGVVSTVMDEYEGMNGPESYSNAFDETYGGLNAFLEDLITSPQNYDSVNTLTTLHGMGEIHSIQTSQNYANIILLVNSPLSLINS